MRWLGWRRPVQVSNEADAARFEAQRAFMDARNFSHRAERIRQVANQIAERNHIAEALESAVRPYRRAE